MKSLLPIFQDDNRNFMMMQTKWASSLGPALSNPILNGNLITNVVLVSGNNTINHLLDRKYQGWFMVDQNASATFYSVSSPMPDLTLIIHSSAPVNVSIYIF